MDWAGRWLLTGADAGKGGQGEVKVVRRAQPPPRSLGSVKTDDLTAQLYSHFNVITHNFQQLADRSKLTQVEQAELETGIAHTIEALQADVARLMTPQLGALKELTTPPRDANAPARLAREIDLSTKFQHPNLIRVLDADSEGKRWLVTEYHRRSSLDKCAPKPPLAGDVSAALGALMPLAEALAVIHEKGTVHRDVKVKNVFVADDGRLVLGDFGIALGSDGAERLTGSRENVASWQWAPMWVKRGKVDEADATHDVYSFVKLLWSVLADRLDDNDPQFFMQENLWEDGDFDLRKIHPSKASEMELLTPLFRAVLVQKRAECQVQNGTELLVRLRALPPQLKALRTRDCCPRCGSTLEDLYDTTDGALARGVGVEFLNRAKIPLSVRVCRECRLATLTFDGHNRFSIGPRTVSPFEPTEIDGG